MRAPKVRQGLAVLALGSFLLMFACGPAVASTGNWTGVAQTVIVGTKSTGKVSGTPLVFTQFSANGKGPHTLKVPMSTSGFRNLSGFGTAPVKDGNAVWNLNLSGPTNQRSVAHFPSPKLPLNVSVAYELNGKRMKAKDIVGKTGELKVSYVITNVTTRPTKVTFKNVLGSKETTTVKTPVPIAAALDVTVPPAFTNIKAPGASANGNGNGTSTAAWTLFLFDPLGGVKQAVTYQAHVTNAVVPSATLEAAVLPPTTIKPLPTIKEPGAPAVPTVTLGTRLASLQVRLQGDLANLAGKARGVLSTIKHVAVRAALAVSGGAARVAGALPAVSAVAQAVSADALKTSTDLAQASANAADAATRVAPAAVSLLSQAAAGAADASSAMPAIEGGLSQGAAAAADASTSAAAVQGGLNRAAAEAADASQRLADIRAGLEAFPPSVRATPLYSALHAKMVVLEAFLNAHAAGLTATAADAGALGTHLTALSGLLTTTAARAKVLGVHLGALSGMLTATAPRTANDLQGGLTKLSGFLARLSSASANVLAPAAAKAATGLVGLVPVASAVSTKAGQAATNLATATRSPHKRQPKTIHPRQVGGGARLDNAVGKLDGAITHAAEKVDNTYAYLTALDKRAANNKLPAGNAKGATAQVGAFVYSVSGANKVVHQTHLAVFIGGFALVLGILFGIAFYRIRRGMPSSLAPPKSSPAGAKG